MALVILRTLFRLGDDLYILEFEKCGGLDNLEKLQFSNHKSIYNSAIDVIEKYFGGEEIEEKSDD